MMLKSQSLKWIFLFLKTSLLLSTKDTLGKKKKSKYYKSQFFYQDDSIKNLYILDVFSVNILTGKIIQIFYIISVL